MILETILAALVPVGVESVKQVINKFTGGVQPVSVEEQVKLQDADIRRLEALAKLDDPHGTPSQWVVDLRASSRYLGALAVILAGLTTLFIPDMGNNIIAIAMEAVSIVFGFLFGQRIVVNFKK